VPVIVLHCFQRFASALVERNRIARPAYVAYYSVSSALTQMPALPLRCQ
jgi:hypothetical protein